MRSNVPSIYSFKLIFKVDILKVRFLRWEGGLGWGIHVNPWLIHVNV